MPNPGSYKGSRGQFLKDQQVRYTQAVKDGNINDVVIDIQRRYFKRYPITLAHNKEPSQDWLDQVNDDAPDPEIEPPNVNGMSPKDASNALAEHADLMEQLKDRKDVSYTLFVYSYSVSDIQISPFAAVFTTCTAANMTPSLQLRQEWLQTLSQH